MAAQDGSGAGLPDLTAEGGADGLCLGFGGDDAEEVIAREKGGDRQGDGGLWHILQPGEAPVVDLLVAADGVQLHGLDNLGVGKIRHGGYKTTIDGLFQMTDEQKNAWGVIGNICDTNWDTDFPMTEEPAGTYTSDVLELKAGQEFKVRQGASWDVNFGVEFNGANIVVEKDGKYKVQLVWDGAQGGTVTLIEVTE